MLADDYKQPVTGSYSYLITAICLMIYVSIKEAVRWKQRDLEAG